MAEYTVRFETDVEITVTVAADSPGQAEELARDRAQDALNRAEYSSDAMITGSVVDEPGTVTQMSATQAEPKPTTRSSRSCPAPPSPP